MLSQAWNEPIHYETSVPQASGSADFSAFTDEDNEDDEDTLPLHVYTDRDWLTRDFVS